jgi:hypothetical protein
MEKEVTAWFRQQRTEFYAAGFQGLVKRWDKYLNEPGDYVDKQKYFSNQYSCLSSISVCNLHIDLPS